MEEKVQEEIRAEAKKHEDELQSGNDKHEKVSDGAIRGRNMEEFHQLMDKHIEARKDRIARAESRKDTTVQWDLIAAAVEAANIEFHGLTGKEATKMRGRSKITFPKKQNDILHRDNANDDNDDFQTSL